jgi:MFS family permease
VLPIHAPQEFAESHPHPLRDLSTGLRFVFENKIILATITLDLFAVLFGGATALLPIFADRILHVGPAGLGWLRAAPSMGAICMAITLAHRRPMQRPGVALLFAVAGFGLVTVVFGLSRSFPLSLAMLFLSGAFDNVSVVVRHTIVQILTPDSMRGRVSAVNNVFIGSSNEIGAFESGVTAAWFGVIVSVVGGGIATVLTVLLVAALWKQVLKLGPFTTLQPES